MTQEQKTKIGEHYDELHALVSDCGFNVPNDINDALRAAYLAGADYALDIYRPRWISVEDELPPMHCHLQDLGESTYGRGKIFCDSEPVITHRVDGCIDMHCLMFNGEKNEFVWGGWNGSHSQPFDGSMITHWMHLPQPPKEGGAL